MLLGVIMRHLHVWRKFGYIFTGRQNFSAHNLIIFRYCLGCCPLMSIWIQVPWLRILVRLSLGLPNPHLTT